MIAVAPPLSVYLHLPWCESKCPYCDFNSHSKPDEPGFAARQQAYVDAMCADIAVQSPLVDGRIVETVFIGGGTPSLFAPSHIARLLTTLSEHLTLARDAEVTMEANPGSLDQAHFDGYRNAGVNRLSIGGQSLSGEALQRLGRMHSPEDTVHAVTRAADAGFGRINVDLMYGLPGQTLADAIEDADKVIDLGVSHVSHYQLTLEPNTRFYARPPELPDDDLIADMMQATSERFAGHGLARYEVSALAAADQRCQHNLNYWQFGDYLAIGAGAHGKLTIDGRVYRYMRPMHPSTYTGQGAAGWQPESAAAVSERQLPFEFMLNALRLTDGFSERLYEFRTGLPFDRIRARLQDAERRGLISNQCDRWRPTPRGAQFLNNLIGEFLPD